MFINLGKGHEDENLCEGPKKTDKAKISPRIKIFVLWYIPDMKVLGDEDCR